MGLSPIWGNGSASPNVLRVRATRTVTVEAPAHAVQQAILALIERTRGWRILWTQDDTVRIRVDPSWRSWGEEVDVRVDADGAACTVTASTRPLIPTTLIDFGKGKRNLDAVIHAVTQVR